MPRIPTSQVSNLPAGAPIPRGTSMSVMMGPGQALASGSLQVFDTLQEIKKVEARAKAKAEKQAAEAYVNPLGSDAIPAWNLMQDTVHRDYGPGSYESIDVISSQIDTYISDAKLNAPSDYAAAEAEKDLYRLKEPFMRNFVKNQRKEFVSYNTSVLKDTLNRYRTQIGEGDNWKSPLPYYTNGLKAINKSSWLSVPEQVSLAQEFSEGVSADVLTGWFDFTQDKIEASEMIRNGNVPDDMKPFLSHLDTDQRNELADDLLDQHNELLRAENAQFQIKERAKKENVNKVLLEFFSTTTPEIEGGPKTHTNRLATIALLRRLNLVTPTVLRQMEDFVSGKEFIDDQKVESDILAGIYDGSIRSVSDVLPYIGEGLSFQTFSDKYIPLIQSQQHTRFNSAANFLKNRLGIPDQGFLSLSLDPKAPERRRMTALSDLQREFAKDPSIDLFKKAEELVKKIEQEDLITHQNKVRRLREQQEALTKSPEFATNRALQEEAANIQIEIDYLEKNR